jgi:hypothetical protein
MSSLSDKKRHENLHRRLDEDLPYYARHVLKIKPKVGTTEPFVFNKAQLYLHAELEKQLSELGYVRALILKGRQQGCSTYVAARYYHKAVRVKDQSVFILSHDGETTKKLFSLVERYYELSPSHVRPTAAIANRTEYKFNAIGSQYAVGTARNESVGRGGTVQLFHGSEVAFWEKTDGIETGVLQSIADIPETEVILESTADGMTGMFYRKCMSALEGKGDYRLIFIPWFWQDEYSRDIPSDGEMSLSDEEDEYKKNYKLTNEQVYWRRAKIIALGSPWKFKQEYPANVMEAFQTSGTSLIRAEAITNARKSSIKTDEAAPLIMGVDPARNRDRTVFAYRRGRTFMEPEVMVFDGDEDVQMQIAGMIAQRIQELGPAKVFIDVGQGYGVRDRLVEIGYGDIVEGIHFGSSAMEPEIYINKRAEMWCNMRDWFHGEEGEVSIPDDDLTQKDLASMPEEKATSSGKIKLVSKDEIRAKSGMSPDIGDAMCLTFAYPVQGNGALMGSDTSRITKKKAGSPLKTLRRRDQSDNIAHSPLSSFWTK